MRYVLLILIAIVTIFLVWLNFPLVYHNTDRYERISDAVMHLNFLEKELKQNGLGERMQSTYPEGYVFINSLYGLSWCELALADPGHGAPLKNKALSEALFAYTQVNSDIARLPFDKTLYPEYGMYYFGWKNYLLSKILLLDTSFAGHESMMNEFRSGCFALKQIINEKESPYTQTYPGNTWPADMFTAAASLKNYDRIFGVTYEPDIRLWIEKVKTRLDPETGMVPHRVNSGTGRMMQGPRGSSMSLTLRMLAEIDSGFAAEQYRLLEKNFVSDFLGLPYLREYPKGVEGKGDVDSGPVIFGIGFSGTVVMTGAFAVLGMTEMFEHQYRTLNTFGFSTKSENTKMYLLGKFPMADAFIAWGLASGINNMSSNPNSSELWISWFTIASLSFVLLLWLLFFRKRIFRRK